MERNVNEAILNEDTCAKALVDLLSENEEGLSLSESVLYHNFPVYRNDDDSASMARILIVSKHHGIVVFECTDQTTRTLQRDNIGLMRKELEQIHSVIYAELLKSSLLRTRIAKINVQVVPALFLPNFEGDIAVFEEGWEELTVVREFRDLTNLFTSIHLKSPLDAVTIKETVAILEGSKGLLKPKERSKTTSGHTKGRILDEIESQIANFDTEQKRAALITLDNPQRIRGLAGSGKTIILTMKAAQIHLQHPEADLFYTFYTRSLYSFIIQLITKFYRRFSGKDPNWEKLRVLHAWGGPNLPGVYYITCINNGIAPIAFKDVRHYKEPFQEICKRLIKAELKESFDYAILDEGQDFPPEFYRICRAITKNNRVIWGYDECQNIFDISIQDTKATFGKDPSGNYYIDFANLTSDSIQDLVLHQCYRNPRRILVSSFGVGLGIYNERILQMPENNDHWEDLGFEVLEGNSKIGDSMVITRPQENSLLVKNELLESEDTVNVEVLENLGDECKYVAEKIIDDLRQDLLPEDILVISLDDRHARTYFREISDELSKHGVNTFNILDAAFYSKDFYAKDHVTLSTVYRAKGNEAGSVYVVGADAVFENKDSTRERNKIFTAMTRAKAWVTITGIGSDAQKFKDEIEAINKNYPEFKFIMPDPDLLKVFQRDLSKSQGELIKIRRQLDDIAKRTGLSTDEILNKLKETDKGEL